MELEIAKLSLELLKDKSTYLSNLINRDKRENIKNDIKVTTLYINKLKEHLNKLGETLVNVIYVRANPKEKIVFREYMIREKSVKQIAKENPELSTAYIYKTINEINGALAKIKIKENNIWDIVVTGTENKK